jgi:hypothetical protein
VRRVKIAFEPGQGRDFMVDNILGLRAQVDKRHTTLAPEERLANIAIPLSRKYGSLMRLSRKRVLSVVDYQ